MTSSSDRRLSDRLGLVAVALAAAVGAWLVAPLDLALELGGLLVVLGTAAIFTGPFGLLIAFIVVLFVRPGDFFPALEGAGLAKAFAGSAVVLLLLEKALKRDTSWARSHYNPIMAWLTAAALLASVYSTDPGDSIAFFKNVFVKIVVLWVLMLNIIDTRARTTAFQVCIALMTSGIAVYSIWTRVVGHNLVEGSRSSFVGLLGDPNDLALALLMAVPFLVEATLHPRLRASRTLWAFLLALNVSGILVTQSRGGLLALGVAGYMLMRHRIRSRLVSAVLVGVALVGAVTYSGITERRTVVVEDGALDSSARGRLDAWFAGARMLKDHPLTGVGLLQATPNYSLYAVNPVDWRPKTSHNAFVQCAAEAGLLGLIPFCLLVLMASRTDRHLLEHPPDDATPIQEAFLRSQLATLAAVMTAAFFLSVAWSWFFYIVIAQSATAHRVWITMPEVIERHRTPHATDPEPRRFA